MKKGFTLIELLVVVLIIGILAAVALPKYQVAVAKTRVATFLPLLKTLGDAEEVFYLSNGHYAYSADELDVSIPAACEKIDAGWLGREAFRCGQSVQIFVGGPVSGDASLLLQYCPSHHASSPEACYNNAEVSLIYRLKYFTIVANEAGKHYCFPRSNSSLANQVCKSISGLTASDIGGGGYSF